jgi:hypothetical protein
VRVYYIRMRMIENKTMRVDLTRIRVESTRMRMVRMFRSYVSVA